jgi:DHA1 family bicyclomycin/chloramphenicol resistance-like MFS transporter
VTASIDDGRVIARRTPSARVIFLLGGLAAIGPLSTNIILPSFPSLARQFHIDDRELGATLSSFFFAFAIGQLFVGPLSDRFGRRPLIVGGLALFLLGTILCGVAETLNMLIAGRVVQALGACAASVLSRAISRDLFDGEALTRVFSLTMIATAAAPGFSPIVGSALDGFFGWRSIFIVVAMAAILLNLAYNFGLGETHPKDRRAPHTIWSVARAYLELVVDWRFISPAFAVSAIYGGLYAFFGTAPAILVGQLGLTPVQLGLFFAASVVVVVGAGLAAPRLAHRAGSSPIALGAALIALIGGIMLIATGKSGDLSTFSTAVVIFLFGVAVVTPLGSAISLSPFGPKAGMASALLGFMQMTCAAISTQLAAILHVTPWVALGWVMCGGSVVAIPLFLLGHIMAVREKASAI